MEAVIFIGVQGSGKTTFYRERFFDRHVRISLDLLRTRNRERQFLDLCIATGQRFVIDNTNSKLAERAVYIAVAKAARFRIVGFYFRTSLGDALRRNAQRTGKHQIPVRGVISTFKHLEPPMPEDGFDELYTVTINSENTFVISPWSTGVDGHGLTA